MRLSILAALLAIGGTALHAQSTGNTTIQPDCLIPFTFTAAGSFPATPTTNGAGDNRTKGCAAWTLMYQNTGMTSVSVTLQSGSSVSTTVSWGSFAGTISTGFVNPIVSDTGGSLQAVNGTADISWVRVNVAATGTGTLTGVLYGFRNSSAAVNGGGGGALPCGPTVGEVQLYASAGAFGCDVNFVYATTVLGEGKSLTIGGVNTSDPQAYATRLNVIQNYTGASPSDQFTVNMYTGYTSTTAMASLDPFNYTMELLGNQDYLTGVSSYSTANFNSSGTIGSIISVTGDARVSQGIVSGSYTGGGVIGVNGFALNNGGTVNALKALRGQIGLQAGTTAVAMTVEADVPDGSTGLTTLYQFYSPDIGSGSFATNLYYSWFDSRGVGRCREDNTFDSVGQVICSVYNPQFTKYVPGAANYERIVYGEWSANIAEMGAEAGGTGTLRKLQMIGNGLGEPTYTFATLGTMADNTMKYCSDCTVTSGIDNTCAGSGSGAHVEAINGAKKCWQ